MTFASISAETWEHQISQSAEMNKDFRHIPFDLASPNRILLSISS